MSIMLIWNKRDLSLLRKVTKNEAQFKANKYGIKFYETSALDYSNIKHTFEELIKDIYIKMKNNYFVKEEKYKNHVRFDLNKQQHNKQR